MRRAFYGLVLAGIAGLAPASGADGADDIYVKAAAAFSAGRAQEAYEMLRTVSSSHGGIFKFDLLLGESACQTPSADMWGAQYLEEMSRRYETELRDNEDEHRQLMKADIACISSLRPDDHNILEPRS
jgi:hypothetical protein